METKEIWKAIIEVMKEVNIIWKNTEVWSWNNKYKAVSDKDVKEAIRESMGKNWLSIMSTGIKSTIRVDRWEEEVQKYGSQEMMTKTKQSVFTEVETKYLLLHTSWESIELAWYGQWVDTQDKWAGKATTYALKNVLINLFLVPTGDDTDNTHSKDIAVPQKKSSTEIYELKKSDIEAWNWKIYWNSIFIDWDKKTISQEQLTKLKAHPKYTELPPKK